MPTSNSTPPEKFRHLVQSPFKLRMFMLAKLPMALLAGLQVKNISEEQAEVTISYKYLNKNPFDSIYFASLSMAAELSTGLLCMMQTYQSEPAISMLVVKMEGDFTKKALGKISFRCADGLQIKQAVEKTLATGEGVTVLATSIGTDSIGDKVAEFRFTWSLKAKKQKLK